MEFTHKCPDDVFIALILTLLARPPGHLNMDLCGSKHRNLESTYANTGRSVIIVIQQKNKSPHVQILP